MLSRPTSTKFSPMRRKKPSVIFRHAARRSMFLDYLDSGVPATKVQCLRDLGFLTSQ